MTIQHQSLKAELLYLIGRATAPLSCIELYEKCDLAEDVAKVAKALANLQSDKKIARVPGEGRARYTLAEGVAAPAPAGKTGRSKAVQKDDASRIKPITGIRPAPEPGLPALDIPSLGDQIASLNGAAGKSVRQKETPAKPAENTANRQIKAENLADAIIARLKRDFGGALSRPIDAALEVNTAPAAITINVERVEINVSVGVSA